MEPFTSLYGMANTLRLSKKQAQLDLPPPQPLPHNDKPAIIQPHIAISQVERDILAACLIGEAGGEKDPRSMTAVMNVIVNRAHGDPSKFAQVALKPYQFSMFNNATVSKKEKLGQIINKLRTHPKWNQAGKIVDNAVQGHLKDVTKGATHYHTTAVKPSWAKELRITGLIGNHKFYTEQPSKHKKVNPIALKTAPKPQVQG